MNGNDAVDAGDAILITDVALRDGLQNQPETVATHDKIALIERLLAAGVCSIEAASFVSPKAVPRMADADVLMPALPVREGVRYSALIPNARGLARALAAGAREVAVVLAATETMNQKNINMGLDAAVQVCEQTLRQATEHGLATRAYVAVAVECPFEGLVEPAVVRDLALRMAAAGAQEVVLADTIGAAAPGQIAALVREVAKEVPLDLLGIHLHDTRGMGLANAWAAMQAGVRRFDSSAGGIGGCPFAPGAAGNLATEDLVLMAHQCGVRTGIDLPRLYEAVDFAQQVLGRPIGGRSSVWYRRRHGHAA